MIEICLKYIFIFGLALNFGVLFNSQTYNIVNIKQLYNKPPAQSITFSAGADPGSQKGEGRHMGKKGGGQTQKFYIKHAWW